MGVNLTRHCDYACGQALEILSVDGCEFQSLMRPPQELRAAATRGSSCSQRVGCRADADDHGTHVAKNRSKNQSLKGGACAHSFRLPGPRPGPDPRVAAALGGKPQPFVVSSSTDQSAEFSPDGRRVVFASGQGMDGTFIWLSNADGSAAAQLTSGSEDFHGSPRWSPDGQWIVFEVFSKDGHRSVKVVAASGGQIRELTGGPSNNGVPSWSHDGKWIYFWSDRTGRPEIWRAPAHGGTAEQITRDGGYVALESPDGKTLYYTKDGSGPLFARRLGVSEEHQILPRVMRGGFCVFDDGIYYLDYRGKSNAGLTRLLAQYEIRFYQFASRNSRLVASAFEGWPGPGLSVSPDRRSFLFTMWRDTEDNLMLIENFR